MGGEKAKWTGQRVRVVSTSFTNSVSLARSHWGRKGPERMSRLESEREARGVEVQDGDRARGERVEGGVGRVEPGGGGRTQGRKGGTGVEEGNTR